MAGWLNKGRDRDDDVKVPAETTEPVSGTPDRDGGEVLLFRSRDDDTDTAGTESGTGPRVIQVPVTGTEGEAVDAELVDEESPVVPVNLPGEIADYVSPWQREVQRRAVVPVWLRDKTEAKTAARWAASYAGHHAAFHAIRLPLYGGTLLARSPRGAGRVIAATTRWITDSEAAPLRQQAVRVADAAEYMRLARLRSERQRARLALFATGTLAAAGTGLALMLAGPAWLPGLTVAGLIALLGKIGAPADRPLTGRAVVTHKVPKLTDDMVVRALSALGIAEINKAIAKGGTGISFPAPITRDGPGFRADVDLPYGVTAVDIIERRDRVASGLRRPLGCVWPEPAHDQHAGRLVLWVGDRDMSQAKPAPWPLAKRGTADIFKPIPFGTDQRGRPATVTLMYDNVLIGAMPGAGKTFALRGPLLAAALDPLVRLWLYELKGTGDLGPLEPVCERYSSGADDESAEAALLGLRALRDEVRKRADIIKRLPRDVCPENKVTAELCSRNKGLRPIVMAIDECQNLFTHPDHGAEAADLATAIIKLGRALGVILLLATQRPDAKSLPTGVSANVGIRFCLRVTGQLENDMVLGTSAYRNGVRATTLTPKDKGIGYLSGASDDPQVVRTYYVDGPAAEVIVTRARALREAAGTLTGHAIGEKVADDETRAASVLADVAAVLVAGEDKVWSETIVNRLAGLRPDQYKGWEPAQLAAALAPYGVKTVQVWGKDEETGVGANRRGITRNDLDRAITKHQPRPVDAPRSEPSTTPDDLAGTSPEDDNV
jgi:S-DNA-T family DNA segregation ATPase FtsK/SpoIIIE